MVTTPPDVPPSLTPEERHPRTFTREYVAGRYGPLSVEKIAEFYRIVIASSEIDMMIGAVYAEFLLATIATKDAEIAELRAACREHEECIGELEYATHNADLKAKLREAEHHADAMRRARDILDVATDEDVLTYLRDSENGFTISCNHSSLESQLQEAETRLEYARSQMVRAIDLLNGADRPPTVAAMLDAIQASAQEKSS